MTALGRLVREDTDFDGYYDYEFNPDVFDDERPIAKTAPMDFHDRLK